MLSESLSAADELPDEFRAHYAHQGRQLRPLIGEMVKIMDDVGLDSSGDGALKILYAAEVLAENIQPKITKAIDRLGVAEYDMIQVLNGVGRALQSTSVSMVTWEDGAEFEALIELHEVPERRCYTNHFPAAVRIDIPLYADYFAVADSAEATKRRRPHYLLAGHLMPSQLVPLIRDIRFEVVVWGEGLANWRTRKMARFGLLP